MDNFLKVLFNFVIILFKARFIIWFSSGQPCTDSDECGLTKSVCTSEKCNCNTSEGYEDSNGLETVGGFCTKSLGKFKHFIWSSCK